VKNQAKEAKLKAKHKAKNQEYLQNGESKPPEFYEAATNKRRSHEADTLALITVGRITYLTEEVASKYGVSKDAFTKRCAELFYASQVRQ
jgi:hypothetical protein